MKVYYLLYKLKISPLFWIVNIDINYEILYKHIKDFKSNEENYYIICKKLEEEDYSYNILEFKNFTIYNKDKNDLVLNYT